MAKLIVQIPYKDGEEISNHQVLLTIWGLIP